MNGMSDIVKSITRIILAPLLLFGAYIMLSATHSHGAGFAGGVIIALAILLFLLAFGRAARNRLQPEHLETMASAALFGLVIITSLTLFFKGTLVTGLLKTASWLLLSNVLLCLAVAASLLIVFMNLLSFKGPEE